MCTRLNLQLDSVVVMENAVGCVCRAASAPATPTASAGAGAARMVMLNDERARQIAQQARRD